MKNDKKLIALLVVLVLIIGEGIAFKIAIKQRDEQRKQADARFEQVKQEWERRDQEVIQIAKDIEIENGVTLSDGVQAYCGTDGNWSALNDLVFLKAHGDNHWIEARFEVNRETEKMSLLEFDSDLHPANDDEFYEIVSDMIQAAKQ